MNSFPRVWFFASFAAAVSPAAAQTLPPIRSVGPALAVSSEPLASVSQVRVLSNGHVLVNDNAGRRVVMFDSALKSPAVVADSTDASGNAYNERLGGLIAYLGDSTLFAAPSASGVARAFLLIDPQGRIARSMAFPRPSGMFGLIGGPYGTPGLDAQGRLVFRIAIAPPPRQSADEPPWSPDSSLIVRYDFATRGIDTLATYGIPRYRAVNVKTELPGGRFLIRPRPVIDPIPWTDDWAVLADGTIAIIRGREFRVDFLAASRTMTSGAKLPFEWQRLADEDKSRILDSVKTQLESLAAAQRAASARRDSLVGRTAPAGAGSSPPGPLPPEFVALNEMPDYRPAFSQGASHGDLDGNLWMRTSAVANGGVIYYVVNRAGELVARVQVPPGRVIAGFGPGGVVYMGVLDGITAHVERARVSLR
jgi:hypothetical protein